MFKMSKPLLPLFLFKLSDESAICLNSLRTNSGIIKDPSIKPVLQISAILPSIITLVSSIFGEIRVFAEDLSDLLFNGDFFRLMIDGQITSSFSSLQF